MRALLFLIRKEFLQVRRDPAMLRIIFVVPVIQLLVLSYAANLDLVNVPVTVLDQDRTADSRAVIDAFLHSDTFVQGPVASSPGELQDHLVHDRADLSLWIPPHYARDLAAGRPARVGLAVDGTNSAAAGKTAGYARRIVAAEGARLAAGGTRLTSRAGATAEAGTGGPRVEGIVRFLYNPELESRFYMVPGILIILVTIISALLTGMAVVREKEIGTLEQLMVTPLRAWQLIAGKVIPFAILSYLTLSISTALAIGWFRVPVQGSLVLLAVAMAAYLLVTLGGGLLASTVSSTQQQAMFTVWFFLVFGILMSGFFYPIANMPWWARLLTYANPMRYSMSIVRGIFLRGAGLADLWPDLVRLTGLGVLVFTAAVLRFSKRTA
ncbi:MAG: ABC transporter permease [Candidatus Eiseniibacteriota bacterium]